MSHRCRPQKSVVHLDTDRDTNACSPPEIRTGNGRAYDGDGGMDAEVHACGQRDDVHVFVDVSGLSYKIRLRLLHLQIPQVDECQRFKKDHVRLPSGFPSTHPLVIAKTIFTSRRIG